MIVILDGARMTDREAAHAYLQEKLDFPDDYGANLDALFDLLSTESRSTTIYLIAAAKLTEHLGDYAEGLIDTLRDAAEENPQLVLHIHA